jgi:hypothetical protein
MSAGDRLEDWVQSVQPAIMHLEAFQVPGDVKLDFSPASLRRVEEILLDRFGDAADLDDPDEQGLVEGAMAYVGETLMRVAGGSWTWEAGSQTPVVQADPELGLAPEAPRRLLATAVERGDGEQLAAACAAWSAAVAKFVAQRPSWHPDKRPTPGLDRAESPDLPDLNRWLEQRDAGFAGWVSRYAPDGTWDFSPGSLDALASLVRRIAPTDEELQDPSHRDFADGASWYLGEVMRRGIGGRWMYQEDERDPSAPVPSVDLPGPRVRVIVPFVYLRIALEDPGFLRARFDKFAA